jgi:hypothetical protein
MIAITIFIVLSPQGVAKTIHESCARSVRNFLQCQAFADDSADALAALSWPHFKLRG